MNRAQDPSAATQEIVRMHAAFEGWFSGTLAADRLEPDIAGWLHEGFRMIQPSGAVSGKADFVASLGPGHGSNLDFRITIEEPEVIATWPGLILATYVEYQAGARNSARENRRRSTVLFQTGPHLLWRHLQETGLPG